MVFPWLILSVAFLAVLAYFARKNVTWGKKIGTHGSIGMAVIVFIIAAFIGWGIDAYFDWSVVPQYMYAVGGSLQGIAIVFFALYALLCLSMLVSSYKVGTMVA